MHLRSTLLWLWLHWEAIYGIFFHQHWSKCKCKSTLNSRSTSNTFYLSQWIILKNTEIEFHFRQLTKNKILRAFWGPAMEWNLLEVNLFILFNFGSSIIPLWELLTPSRETKQERRLRVFVSSPSFPSVAECSLYDRDEVLSSSAFLLIKLTWVSLLNPCTYSLQIKTSLLAKYPSFSFLLAHPQQGQFTAGWAAAVNVREMERGQGDDS